MKKLMAVAAALLALAAGVGTLSAGEPGALLPNPSWYTPPEPQNLAEFLAAEPDLVVIGTVQSAVEADRGYARIPQLMAVHVTEVRLTVEEVLFGSAPGSTLELSLSNFGHELKPGDHILAWGTYTPEDNWRLRGRGRLIDGDTLLGRSSRTLRECGDETFVPLSLATVRHDASAVRHTSSIFNGNRTVALVRLRSSSRWSPSGLVYEVDSLAWVLGKGEAVPRLITFPPVPGCSPGMMPGDSLLLPLPPGFRGSTLYKAQCPTALRVKEGFVPGLGVSLDKIAQALDTTDLVVRVRPFQRKEN